MCPVVLRELLRLAKAVEDGETSPYKAIAEAVEAQQERDAVVAESVSPEAATLIRSQ